MTQVRARVDRRHGHEPDSGVLQVVCDRCAQYLAYCLVYSAHPVFGHGRMDRLRCCSRRRSSRAAFAAGPGPPGPARASGRPKSRSPFDYTYGLRHSAQQSSRRHGCSISAAHDAVRFTASPQTCACLRPARDHSRKAETRIATTSSPAEPVALVRARRPRRAASSAAIASAQTRALVKAARRERRVGSDHAPPLGVDRRADALRELDQRDAHRLEGGKRPVLGRQLPSAARRGPTSRRRTRGRPWPGSTGRRCEPTRRPPATRPRPWCGRSHGARTGRARLARAARAFHVSCLP